MPKIPSVSMFGPAVKYNDVVLALSGSVTEYQRPEPIDMQRYCHFCLSRLNQPLRSDPSERIDISIAEKLLIQKSLSQGTEVRWRTTPFPTAR